MTGIDEDLETMNNDEEINDATPKKSIKRNR